ncbi:hypothetical protein [Methylocapsa aurea]|uniref:hypothetical protein n=1 Tax=Methylocapsa aurea TaxID=663610 RepID=UPI00056AD475|nr:hypothetical protein [Methylocapsa aurea]
MQQRDLRSDSSANGGESARVGASGLYASVSESAARGADALSTIAADAMNSAGSELESLRSELNSLKDTVAKYVAQAGNETARTAHEITSNVTAQLGDVAGSIADKGGEVASIATKQVKTLGSELENMARRNPIGALAGALMVGVLIGMMGRRS